MNMNYNQYPGNGMMNNNMNMGMQNNMMQQPMQIQDPLALEKKEKKVKAIKKLILFIVLFIIMFAGKKYIDYITVDYQSIVDEALSKYYISSDAKDLEPIADLLNKYTKNANIVKKIQNRSYEVVGNWFVYIDNKYVCDKNNANSCTPQLNEFERLNAKLEMLGTVKGGGYFIIQPNAFESLKSEGANKVTRLAAATRNKTYTSPENSEAIYQAKCANINTSSTDCKCNNQDGICSCSISSTNKDGSKKIEDIKCYKPEVIKEK